MIVLDVRAGDHRAFDAAHRVLGAMRAQGRLDTSDAQASQWTALPIEDVRMGLLLLSSLTGARLFSTHGGMMLAFERMPGPTIFGAPPQLAGSLARLREIYAVAGPLLGLGAGALSVSGFLALYLGVGHLVFPAIAGPATNAVWALVAALFVFVLPGIAIVFVVALPVLVLVAAASGSWAIALALLPLAAGLIAALPTLWQVSRVFVERAWGVARVVYNFGRVTGDAIEDERLFVLLARARRGRIVAADMSVLFGDGRKRAIRRIFGALASYGGRVIVDPNGRLWFEFPEFSDGVPLAPPPIWVREREPRLVFDEVSRRVEPVTLVGLALGVWAWLHLMLEKFEPTRLAAEYVWRHWDFTPRLGFAVALATVIYVPTLLAVRRIMVWRRQRGWERRRRWFDLIRLATRHRVTVLLGEFEEAQFEKLGVVKVAAQGDRLDVEFPGFEQLEFSHDAWEQPHRI